MRKIKSSNEDEMILEFLKGEFSSVRFGEKLQKVLAESGNSSEIILNGNLINHEENRKRKEILSKFRGYPNRDLFENFPKIDSWEQVEFQEEDLDTIYYIDYSYWNELSNHTSKPKEASKVIKSGKEIYQVSNEPFIKGVELLDKLKFPPVILITCNDKKYLIIEGHSRLTIYGMKPEKFAGTYGFIGHCSEQEMRKYDAKMLISDK